jgi:hypothetical protein
LRAVTIKDGVEYINKDIIAGENVPETIVPLNQGTRQATVDPYQATGTEMKFDHGKGIRVTIGGNSNVPVDNPFSDVRDQFGRQVSDPRKIDSDTCTIPIGNIRCTLKTVLDTHQ